MKYVKTYGEFLNEQMINEIGEASSKGFDWEWDNFSKKNYKATGELIATFKTDNETYEVKIEREVGGTHGPDAYVLGFGVSTGGYHNVDYDVEVNKGEMFNVLSTVVNIIKKAVDMLDPRLLIIVPSKADKKDSRRLRLYKAYIRKQIPNASVKVEVKEFKGFKGKLRGKEEVILVEL
jgi:hypothetical protein